MLILGIESSCDETGAAIAAGQTNEKRVKLLSNVVASSLSIHAKSGGIIPENAAREQIKYVIPVIKEAIQNAKIQPSNIDAIAVTYGPGLIGSLLIGIETAKTLSYIWRKPLIPVSHLIGHVYANFIQLTDNRGLRTDSGKTEITAFVESVQSAIRHPSSAFRPPAFPLIALIVSGGHTDLVLMKNHGSLLWLGGTRDDAAGEALDKIGRLLGLPYPGGPHIERAAKKGNANKYKFPRPMLNDFSAKGGPASGWDFSFSGLKTAVFREVRNLNYSSSEASAKSRSGFSTSSNNTNLDQQTVNDISASVQKAIIDVLVKKTLKAAKQYNAKSILLGGGVAANSKLREQFELSMIKGQLSNVKLFAPTKSLCTDNAAMIASAAYFNNQEVSWRNLDANPNLYFNSLNY